MSADGHGVPGVSVVFSIGAGALDPPTSTTDRTGTARATALSTAVTTISAAIDGGMSASLDVLRSAQP